MTDTRQDSRRDGQRRREAAFAVFASIQAIAAVFFLVDAASELDTVDVHTVLEGVIAIGLMVGSLFGVSELRRSHRQIKSQENALAVAAGALGAVIEDHFTAWNFSPAERDVAMLSLKGLDLPDIARLRGVALGTVRAQLAAIYAKSGTSGRAQFASVFVEDLLGEGVGGARHEEPEPAPA